MDVYEAVRTRYSCRRYDETPVPDEVLGRILETARFAPSARNIQSWRIVVVREAATRAKLMEAAKGQAFVGEAPVVLAFCSEGENEYRMTCGQLRYPIDTAILQDHVSLLCTAEGLGTCWIGAFYADRVRAILGIPGEVEVVELMTVGYPADAPPAARDRLPLDTILHWETW